MAHTKRPTNESQATGLDNEQHIEKLRQISNEAYHSLVILVPDERERAFVIAIIAGTFLMNIDNDPDFHDDVLEVIITTIVNHPRYGEGIDLPNLRASGGNGKPH